MNKLIAIMGAACIALVVTGCSSAPKQKTSYKKEDAQWEQFKAKKAQDELSAEIDKQ